MNVNVKVISHKKHRYPTCGDWYYDNNNNLQVRVSRLPDGRYEQLLMVHEFVEALLCDAAGVTDDEVTAFDKEFERQRPEGSVAEPGDEVRAPYHKQHRIATAVEMLLAAELGVDWSEYEKALNNLPE